MSLMDYKPSKMQKMSENEHNFYSIQQSSWGDSNDLFQQIVPHYFFFRPGVTPRPILISCMSTEVIGTHPHFHTGSGMTTVQQEQSGRESPGPPPPSPDHLDGTMSSTPAYFTGVVEMTAEYVRALFPDYQGPPPSIEKLCCSVATELKLSGGAPILSLGSVATLPQFMLQDTRYDPEHAVVHGISVRGQNTTAEMVGFRSSVIDERVRHMQHGGLVSKLLSTQRHYALALPPKTPLNNWFPVLLPQQFTDKAMAVAVGCLNDQVIHNGVIVQDARAYIPVAHILAYNLCVNRGRIPWQKITNSEEPCIMFSVSRDVYDPLVANTLAAVQAQMPYSNMMQAEFEMALIGWQNPSQGTPEEQARGLPDDTCMQVLIAYTLFPRDVQGHMPTYEPPSEEGV